MNINIELLNYILEQIKIKKITEKDCLKACDINTSFLSDWKSGKIKSPSFDKIFRIATYLGISLDSLINNNSNNQPDEKELLALYSQLDPIKQAEFKGELKGYLKAKNGSS